MIGTISDPVAAAAVGGAFGGASESTREWMERAVKREDRHGDKRTREDSFTDQFLDQMDGEIRERLEAIGRTLSGTGVSVSVEFEPSNMTATEEHEYGADIGVRVSVRSPGFTSIKAVLIQCKRMYGPAGTPTFPELRGRGEEQARKMLRITPASFFMLYSFGSQPSLIDLAGVPVGMLCPNDEGLIPPSKAQRLGSHCPLWQLSGGSIWDMGISLISASRVLAYSAAATGAGTPFPVDAATVLKGAIPLGVFMVDFVAACVVGDPRDDVVRLATPPKLRVAPVGTSGLPASDPYEGFAVRRYLTVTVDTNPDLFRG